MRRYPLRVRDHAHERLLDGIIVPPNETRSFPASDLIASVFANHSFRRDMSVHPAPQTAPASNAPTGARITAPAAANTASSSARHFRRSCASNLSNGMSEGARRKLIDRAFFLVLTPLAASSLPSLIFCLLAVALWIHGFFIGSSMIFHLPAETGWDRLLAMRLAVYTWIARWNALATLAATALFVSTFLRSRWRRWTAFALVPYALLLCADFTLRLRTILLP